MVEFSYKGRYAFIQYEESADASKAIREMDDKRIAGVRIAVELASKFLVSTPETWLTRAFVLRTRNDSPRS